MSDSSDDIVGRRPWTCLGQAGLPLSLYTSAHIFVSFGRRLDKNKKRTKYWTCDG